MATLTPAEWKSADFDSGFSHRAAFKLDVYNAFVRAVNERMMAIVNNIEAYAAYSTFRYTPSFDPSLPPTPVNVAAMNGYLGESGEPIDSSYTLAPATVGSAATLVNQAWSLIQNRTWCMRRVFVSPGRFNSDGIPEALGDPGVGFPTSAKDKFTRKFPRTINSLGASGSAGNIARFILTASQFAAATQATRDLSGKVFKRNGSGSWELADPLEVPDILEDEGFIQSGDYVGPWILNEIRSALLMMKEIVYGEGFGAGNGPDGRPNLINNGPFDYAFYYSETAFTVRHSARVSARHKSNPNLRTPDFGGSPFTEGNFNAAGTVGDCFRLEGTAFMFKTNGVTRPAGTLVSDSLEQVKHSTNKRKKAAFLLADRGPPPGFASTPGVDSYDVRTFDGLDHGYRPFDPPYEVFTHPFPPSSSMGKGLTDSYGGRASEFSIMNTGANLVVNPSDIDKGQAGAFVANSTITGYHLIPYGFKADITQFCKAEKPLDRDSPYMSEPYDYDEDGNPINEDGTPFTPVSLYPAWDDITVTNFDACGSDLMEGEFVQIGGREASEFDLDSANFDFSGSIQSKLGGKTTVVDTPVGPPEPGAANFGSPPFVPGDADYDNPRTITNGYRVTEILHFANFARDGGFKYY